MKTPALEKEARSTLVPTHPRCQSAVILTLLSLHLCLQASLIALSLFFGLIMLFARGDKRPEIRARLCLAILRKAWAPDLTNHGSRVVWTPSFLVSLTCFSLFTTGSHVSQTNLQFPILLSLLSTYATRLGLRSARESTQVFMHSRQLLYQPSLTHSPISAKPILYSPERVLCYHPV